VALAQEAATSLEFDLGAFPFVMVRFPRLLVRYQVANALIVKSAIVRAALQAVHWFAPPAMPTIVTARLAEGARFLLGTATERGLELGAVARARLDTLAADARR
jgi:hypothetical protein